MLPRRLFLGVSVLWLTARLLAGDAPANRSSLKILTIGNSFANNATAFLPELAKAGGKELVIFRANLGGASLAEHVEKLQAFESNPSDPAGRPYADTEASSKTEKRMLSLREALESQRWDVVTVQQLSNLSFKPESYQPYARILIEYIRKHAPQAEILVHQTWAYREDYPGFQKDGFTQEKMHEAIVDAYARLAKDFGLRIIPVGEAFHAARKTPRWHFKHPDPAFNYERPVEGTLPDQAGSLNAGWSWSKGADKKIDLDFKHANRAGKYLGAAVFYEVLFGSSADGLHLKPKHLSTDDFEDLCRIAHATVVGAGTLIETKP